MRSVAALWNVSSADLRLEEDRLRRLATLVPPAAAPKLENDERVPMRNPEIRGPLDVYYFSFLASAGVDASVAKLERRERGDVLAYEAFNLVDGKRSVSEIRDALAGRYETVPLAEVAQYLDLLAKAGALRFPR